MRSRSYTRLSSPSPLSRSFLLPGPFRVLSQSIIRTFRMRFPWKGCAVNLDNSDVPDGFTRFSNYHVREKQIESRSVRSRDRARSFVELRSNFVPPPKKYHSGILSFSLGMDNNIYYRSRARRLPRRDTCVTTTITREI